MEPTNLREWAHYVSWERSGQCANLVTEVSGLSPCCFIS